MKAPGERAVPRVEWVRKVFDDGSHNAVTDLAAWGGRIWLCFRRSAHHFNVPPGEILVLASEDLEEWDHVATISTDLDDRDPKLVADGGRLWLFFGAARLELDGDGAPLEGGRRWTESYATFTEDGGTWAEPRPIFDPGWWLWRPALFGDGFWCAAYGCDLDPPERAQYVDLLRSRDGFEWERVGRMLGSLQGNEAALHRSGDGRMLAVVRGYGGGALAMEASPPHRSWSVRRLDHWLHAPAIAAVEGRIVLAGRDQDGEGGYVTRLWEWDGGTTRPLADLPSGGDTSYCGLVALEDSSLLVSYYSQHEFLGDPGFRICHAPAAIYLAKLTFSPG